MIKVGIVIINFNTEQDTIECLESIEKLSINNQSLSVYVVDNDSPRKESAIAIEAYIDKQKRSDIKFYFIKSPSNLGFAGGNNLGITDALENGAEYILLLNNDTIVTKNLIKELVESAKKNPQAGIMSPKIYFAKGFEFHKSRYKKTDLGKVIWYAGGIMDWKNVYGKHRGVDEVDRGQYDKEDTTDFATGCCMLIHSQILKNIGMFDENYFLYYEENDFCQRVKKAEYKILYVPKAIVWHKNAQSTGGSGSPLQDYFITRNRMIFGNRYAPFRTRLALFKESLRLLRSGRPWQKKGIQDYYLKRFGRGSFIKN